MWNDISGNGVVPIASPTTTGATHITGRIVRTDVDAASERAAPDDAAITGAWFDVATCRNCDTPLATPYCPQCGQKRAKRLMWRDMGRETWERLRLFESRAFKTLRRLILTPGTVARDYVRGRRTENMHPLTLLIALVALLALILAANRYFSYYDFTGRNADVERMADRVMAYANWSFSLGIFAIFLASWIAFGRRQGYNVVEHAVLSIYCQNAILAAVIVNLLPTLVWHDRGFILWHKQASLYYMYAIKLLIVLAAYKQFFVLTLRVDWPRLALAGLCYAAFGWVLLRLYAAAILWFITVTT